MSWVRSILTEIWGLFVDDGSLAATIVAWLVVCGLLLPLLDLPTGLKGPILFAGLGIVLVESTLRRARA